MPKYQPKFGDPAFYWDIIILPGFHPESPDMKLAVSNLETKIFLSWQETFACKSRQRRLPRGRALRASQNQGIVRRRTTVRRTNKTADWRGQGEKGPFYDGNYL